MKKEELKFKCVVPNEEVFEKIRAGIFPDAEHSESFYFFVSFDGHRGYVSDAAPAFCEWPEPLVSYEQAIEMIAQVEPEQKGEWVEYGVDENGFVFGTNCEAALFKANWQSIEKLQQFIGGVFGGWLWGLGDSTTNWSCFKMGADKSGLSTTCASNWVRPLTPKKIRFWRAEK